MYYFIPDIVKTLKKTRAGKETSFRVLMEVMDEHGRRAPIRYTIKKVPERVFNLTKFIFLKEPM